MQLAEELPSYADMWQTFDDYVNHSDLGKVLHVPGLAWVLAPSFLNDAVWSEVRPWDPGRSKRLSLFVRYWDATFFADQIRFSFVWPMPGLVIDAVPVRFSDQVSIDRMTPFEMEAALNERLIHADGAEIHVPEPRCLRFDLMVPRLVSDQMQPLIDLPPVEPILERFYLAWRLSTDTPLDHAGYLRYAEVGLPEVLVGEHRYIEGRSYAPASVSDPRRLKVLWDAVGDSAVDARLGTALRRFSESVTRTRSDDRIVDLLIAGEALFLDDPRDHSELSYRFSMRAAAFIEGVDRLATFKFFRAAYRVRSTLVHGGSPEARDLLLLDGQRAPDQQAFADELESALRACLTTAVARVAAGQPVTDNWEGLILAHAE
jgi:hypothetical protein